MINLFDEYIVSLAEATKLLPRRRAGKKPHISCLYRWAKSGFRGVKLEVVRVGGTLCTSKEAIARFVAKTTAADPVIGTTDTGAPIERDDSKIEQQLDDLGV